MVLTFPLRNAIVITELRNQLTATLVAATHDVPLEVRCYATHRIRPPERKSGNSHLHPGVKPANHMAIRRFQATVEGTAPLLLSNNLCSDPLSEPAKIKKHFTGKRTKSDKDHSNLRVIDWVYSGYWKNDGRVLIDDSDNSIGFEGFSDLFLPSQNLQRCLRNGATAFKLGREVERALIVENEAELDYEGPRAAEEMLGHTRFVKTSPVVRQKVTNWVTRLTLPSWIAKFFLTVDDDRISIDALERIVKAAGQFEGPRHLAPTPWPLCG